jgi:hypothetical protein
MHQEALLPAHMRELHCTLRCLRYRQTLDDPRSHLLLQAVGPACAASAVGTNHCARQLWLRGAAADAAGSCSSQGLPEEAQQGAVDSASEARSVVPQTWFWLAVATVAHGEVQRPSLEIMPVLVPASCYTSSLLRA